MEIDYREAAFLWDVLQTIVTALLALYVWLSRKSQVNRGAIESLIGKLDIVENRLIVVEESSKHQPTHNDMGRTHERIDNFAQDLKRMEGTLMQVDKHLSMIHEHLLAQGNKK